MNNSFGSTFRITTFGESHGVALGCVVDGCPAGIKITREEIQKECDRRKPGQSAVSTSRKESDRVEILSGVFENLTTGAPIGLLVRNENQRSKDYNTLKNVFRPGHADFTWQSKFGIRDHRGGGRASGRETVARVAAGAIAQKILDKNRVKIVAFADSIGGVRAEKFAASVIEKNSVRAADLIAAEKMEAEILRAKKAGDSIGGTIGVVVKNIPIGLGEPVFDKIDALLGHALLSIGGVKGVEFGAGFAFAGMKGSEANDEFVGGKKIGKSTNAAGGVLGGISDGDEILVRLAVKPTASIAAEQSTVTKSGGAKKIKIGGRHDPCLVPRIVPVVEAMTRITLADLVLRARGNQI